MKRVFYIFCFGVLGLLVQFFAHALIEMVALRFLTWREWHPLWHGIVGVTLLVAGVGLGIRQGFYWWDQIYVKKRYGWIK